jgi:hypothetical protein
MSTVAAITARGAITSGQTASAPRAASTSLDRVGRHVGVAYGQLATGDEDSAASGIARIAPGTAGAAIGCIEAVASPAAIAGPAAAAAINTTSTYIRTARVKNDGATGATTTAAVAGTAGDTEAAVAPCAAVAARGATSAVAAIPAGCAVPAGLSATWGILTICAGCPVRPLTSLIDTLRAIAPGSTVACDGGVVIDRAVDDVQVAGRQIDAAALGGAAIAAVSACLSISV